MNSKGYNCNAKASFVKRFAWGLCAVSASFFCIAFFTPGPLQKASFMGAEYCGSCHSEEYRLWASSPHAKAHDVLPIGNRSDPACLSCHATGVLEKNEPALPGVQCEACHGPGQFYAKLHIKKDPVLSRLLFMQRPVGEQSCLHCHSVDSKLWSPHENMNKIDHWSKTKIKGDHGASPKHEIESTH